MYIDHNSQISKDATKLRNAKIREIFTSISITIKHQLSITRSLRNLRKLSDRQLEDIGLSPELVRIKGRSGYPWKYKL